MNLTKEQINKARVDKIMANKSGEYGYEGNLKHYFKAIFKARNVKNSYHNFRHELHVTYVCFTAIMFYLALGLITLRQARNLLIAALCHDADHSGKLGHDDLEVERAVRFLRKNIAEEDRPWLEEIEALIRATEFPHKGKSSDLPLCAQILRDADMSQALAPVWIQQTIFGLSDEMSMPPIEVLKMQEPFLSKIHFTTDWAKERFPQEVVDDKIDEANGLLELLV